MSYDLIVFNPKNAPKCEKEFVSWCKNQIEWKEEHDYNDSEILPKNMKTWFLEMIKHFPALNGANILETIESFDEDVITDYCIGKDVIYSSFGYPVAEKAYLKVIELAEKHKVGFYDASGTGDVFFPNDKGDLEKISDKKSSEKLWWKFW